MDHRTASAATQGDGDPAEVGSVVGGGSVVADSTGVGDGSVGGGSVGDGSVGDGLGLAVIEDSGLTDGD